VVPETLLGLPTFLTFYAFSKYKTRLLTFLATSLTVKRKRLLVQTCRQSHVSVCLSVCRVYCGKTADWIWMPFGVVSSVGQGMGVLDGVEIVKGERAVLG